MATSSAKKLYLKAYNLVALAGWCCLTAFFAVQLVQCGYDTALTRERVKLALVLVQCFNFLEVLHNAVGIVPGNTFGLVMIHAAWGATEVTRYLYYFLHLDLREPHALTWLRYSLFIVLYPLGTTGELLVVTAASARILGLTLSLDALRYVVYIIYPPSLYYLYTYMLRQRKKELGKAKVVSKLN